VESPPGHVAPVELGLRRGGEFVGGNTTRAAPLCEMLGAKNKINWKAIK